MKLLVIITVLSVLLAKSTAISIEVNSLIPLAITIDLRNKKSQSNSVMVEKNKKLPITNRLRVRRLFFWSRVVRIYSSYKVFQLYNELRTSTSSNKDEFFQSLEQWKGSCTNRFVEVTLSSVIGSDHVVKNNNTVLKLARKSVETPATNSNSNSNIHGCGDGSCSNTVSDGDGAMCTESNIKILRNSDSYDEEQAWKELHEINSMRMLKLCTDLRGFYLKSGQFLGSRHDFMPEEYTSRLSKLHDDVPSLSGEIVQELLNKELQQYDRDNPTNQTEAVIINTETDVANSKEYYKKYFKSVNFNEPIGSASIAQVHEGEWRENNNKVAIKIQNPYAEELMFSDLKNLVVLAEFLQKHELKFDMLSAVRELQKQIHNEFNFNTEARNMKKIKEKLDLLVPEIDMPSPLLYTKQLLVMSYVEGDTLSKIVSKRSGSNGKDSLDMKNKRMLPKWVEKKFSTQFMKTLAKAWGAQIFELRAFNADPHPGNICINKDSKKKIIGLLDWGQVKYLPDDILLKFSIMLEAINSKDKQQILSSIDELGIEISNRNDIDSSVKIAVSMLDTQNIPGYVMSPFSKDNALKTNSIKKVPSDLYLIIRTIQLFRGICYGLDIDFSLAKEWQTYAQNTIKSNGKGGDWQIFNHNTQA